MAKPKYLYPVIVEPLEEGGFFAECPLLQGCHCQNDTVPAVLTCIDQIAEVLLELMEEDGIPIPDELLAWEIHESPKLFKSRR